MELIGTFTNKSNKIKITLNSDKSYSITGLEGFNTTSGGYRFESSRITEYPQHLVLKHSTKPEDIFTSGTYKLPIKILNKDTFVTKDNYFCDSDFNENPIEAIFTRIVR